MHDPETGDMVGIEPKNKSFFEKFGLFKSNINEAATDESASKFIPNTTTISNKHSDDPEGFNSQEIAWEAEKRGFCVLSIGENVDIKGGNFVVESLGRKAIMFKCPENIHDLRLKLGEQIIIKNSNFVIEHYGIGFLKVRGLPGNRIFDQGQIDDLRKQHIKKMKKEMVNTNNKE